ncbi:translation initiation factor eIF3 subunit-domain-containing protein [Catenaria anguillulae PL171]|uniref:Eukaryotic translation initiation factor 3 30 kDa subunit n=1 Tax=Catenaria anguillulae PL171 TaxID=765915 RepID=A0A1Y2HCW3_9FUNG|nr:translation initiation factor eIF3 subunit-domain-containing protein [Catenaria anguillulae PL171]
MSDWEEYAQDAAPAVPIPVPATKIASKWDDEEEESDVADAWDASSDDASDDDDDQDDDDENNNKAAKPAAKPAAAAAPGRGAATPSPTPRSASASASASASGSSSPATSAPPKKRSIKQAAAERQAAEEQRAREIQAKRAAAAKQAELEAGETPAERRARLQRQVEEEDAKHVEDLFGAGGPVPVVAKPTAERNLLTLTPRTKAEFDEYLNLVVERFADFEKRPLYAPFVDTLARKLCERMTKLEDIRKVASSLNALANDRQRQEKEAQKKGKKANTKKQVRVETADDFEEAPEPGAHYAGDYDDFM